MYECSHGAEHSTICDSINMYARYWDLCALPFTLYRAVFTVNQDNRCSLFCYNQSAVGKSLPLQ